MFSEIESLYKEEMLNNGFLRFTVKILDDIYSSKKIIFIGRVPQNYTEDVMRKEYRDWREELSIKLRQHLQLLDVFARRKFTENEHYSIDYYEDLIYKNGKFIDEDGWSRFYEEIWKLLLDTINNLAKDLSVDFWEKYKTDLETLKNGKYIIHFVKIATCIEISKYMYDYIPSDHFGEIVKSLIEDSIRKLKEKAQEYLKDLPVSFDFIKHHYVNYSNEVVFPKNGNLVQSKLQ